MDIKTKFNVGDAAWTIHYNEVVKSTVEKIQIEICGQSGINIFCGMRIGKQEGFLKELVMKEQRYLFTSKEELIKSL